MPEVATREQADDPTAAALLAAPPGIYMTGGDQVALVDVLRRTAADAAMIAAYHAGAVIGGTSAGATAMGDPMIARGGGSGELRRGMVTHQAAAWAWPGPTSSSTPTLANGAAFRACAPPWPRSPGAGRRHRREHGADPAPAAAAGWMSSGRGVVYFLDGHAPPA